MGNARNIAFWVVLFLLVLALFNLFSGGQSSLNARSVSYSDFVEQVESGQVSSVTLDGERVLFRGADGQDYSTIRPDEGGELTDRLIANDVTVNAKPQEQSGFTTVLMTFLPFLLLIGVWIYFMNRMQGGGK
ncbi:ATP-dependent metallopeptidase FtsH/Yme1/Tma family protein, partial [Palleronia sp.]|uniref:ATP-dependent metallopeptidase FtsH/Yme1/Tma family protein n=1 Tax=Palleronia sp. TaxID=1940284 RepID=UPI0035C85AC2